MIGGLFDSTEAAMRASGTLVGAGALLSSAEWLSLRGELEPGGAFPWKLTGSRRFLLRHRFVRRASSLLFETPGVLLLIVARGLCAAWLVVAAISGLGLLAPFLSLAVTTVLIDHRQPYGLDGSDQMTVIVCIGLGLGLALGARRLGVAFVAAEAVLAYFIAGISKLGGRAWRDGTAVPAILSTRSFGSPTLGAVLARQPWVGRGLTWSTVSFESLFPLALLAPTKFLVAFLVAGALLHIGTAASMGLNVFTWAFVGSYPCVIWAAHQLG